MATRPHPPNGSEVRDLDCDDYDSCIDVAAKGGWSGLDCSRCPKMTGTTEIEADRAEVQTVFGTRPSRVIPLLTSQQIAETASIGDLAVMAAVVKAEHKAKGHASSRLVGTFLGIGGKAAALRLSSLELRGMVRRHGSDGTTRWSLK